MGYSYYAGFFRMFAFPPPYPELSTSDYFIRAFTSIVTFFSLAITWLDNLSNRFYEPKTYGEAWRVNAPFFLVPVILGAFACIARPSGSGCCVLAGLHFDSWRVRHCCQDVNCWDIYKKGVGIWDRASGRSCTLRRSSIFFNLLSGHGRDADANRFIEGKMSGTVTAVIQMTNLDSPVNGVPLLVALDRGGRVFFTP